jgi:hypothetical protein
MLVTGSIYNDAWHNLILILLKYKINSQLERKKLNKSEKKYLKKQIYIYIYISKNKIKIIEKK